MQEEMYVCMYIIILILDIFLNKRIYFVLRSATKYLYLHNSTLYDLKQFYAHE